MVYASLVVLFALLLFGLIGFGPALWFLHRAEKRIAYAVGIAPTLGLALVTILGLPLVRYIAPIAVWALPFALLLVIVSLALAILAWRQSRGQPLPKMDWRAILLPALFFLACYLILISPLLLQGIQYTVFRSNPSDAFTYMSLAETLRVVPWNVLLKAIVFSSENANALAALGNASPAGLLTARAVGLPLQLNNMVTLGWLAQIFGLPVYEAYYPYHILAYLNTFLLALVLADVLQVSKGLKYLGAAVISMGFWARFILETDASFEINSTALVLLVIFAWILLEQQAPLVLFSRERLFLAIVASALACTYLIIVAFVVVGFLLFYVVNLVRRKQPLQALLYHGGTAFMALGIFVGTGQLDLVLLNFLYEFGNVDRQKQFLPTVVDLWRANGLNAVWGLPLNVWSISRRIIRLPLAILSNLVGIFLTVIAGGAVWFAFRRTNRLEVQIIISIVGAGVIFFVYALATQNLRAAGKAFTYVYPSLVLTVLAGATYLEYVRPLLQRIAIYGVGGWCIAQIALGAVLPYTNAFSQVFHYSPRNESYNVSAITDYLRRNPPQLLLVDIPRTKSWEFAFYAMFVFSQFPSYFQSGLVIDNNTTFQNFWTGQLNTLPDYAVILKSRDYIGRQEWGTLVAETQDLALYHLTVQDIGLLNEKERELRALEEYKPVFQQTLPLLLKSP